MVEKITDYDSIISCKPGLPRTYRATSHITPITTSMRHMKTSLCCAYFASVALLTPHNGLMNPMTLTHIQPTPPRPQEALKISSTLMTKAQMRNFLPGLFQRALTSSRLGMGNSPIFFENLLEEVKDDTTIFLYVRAMVNSGTFDTTGHLKGNEYSVIPVPGTDSWTICVTEKARAERNMLHPASTLPLGDVACTAPDIWTRHGEPLPTGWEAGFGEMAIQLANIPDASTKLPSGLSNEAKARAVAAFTKKLDLIHETNVIIASLLACCQAGGAISNEEMLSVVSHTHACMRIGRLWELSQAKIANMRRGDRRWCLGRL